MKELTIEEKTKAYDAALETLQEILSSGVDAIRIKTLRLRLQSVFPELKENLDDKIRKALIELVKYAKGNCLELLNKPFNIVSMDAMLAWLKKHDANKEYVFRPLADTMIENAVEQALEQGDVVLAFNGFYTPVKGKTSKEILTEYDHWLEKQGEQKQTWEPDAAQLIVIKDLIEEENTSKVNKVILRGMLDEFKQYFKL